MPKVGGRRVFLLIPTSINPSIRKSPEPTRRLMIKMKPQLVKRSPRPSFLKEVIFPTLLSPSLVI